MSDANRELDYQAYETPAPPAELTDRIMAAVASPPPASRRPPWAAIAAATAVVVAAAVVLLVLLRGDGEGDRTAEPVPSPTPSTVGDDDGGRPQPAPAPKKIARADDKLLRVLPNAEARESLMRAIQTAAARRRAAAPAVGPLGTGADPVADSAAGTLDKKTIQEAMGEIRPLFIECYEMALERTPKLAGKLVVAFTIVGEPDVGGLVAEAELEPDDTIGADDEFLVCMRETIMSLEFPVPKGGGEVKVRYPFIFRGTDGDDDSADSGDDSGKTARKRPTHRPPAPEPGAAKALVDVSELVTEAREQAKRGNWASALSLCQRALASNPSDQEAAMVCALAACNLGDRDLAERHIGGMTSPSRRAMAVQICLKNGIDLREP